MTKITVAQEVVNNLVEMGVKHVFGVPSGGWVDYMEAIRQTEGIEFVLTTHEGGAAFMADVCGRISGAPGVCFGTFGPGATNLATGVGSAYLDRSPMIALSDEMPAPMRGRITQMGIDHQALFAPITKATTRLESEHVSTTLQWAQQTALTDRPGPVHVGLPVGLSAEFSVREAAAENTGTCLPSITAACLDPAPAELLSAMQSSFQQSQKPLLVVGLDAVRAGVQSQIVALAEKFSMPIVLTPMAKGMLPEDHPCYTGVLFHALSDQVGKTHQQADLVIAVGYDPVEFNFEQWLPDAPLININSLELDATQCPEVIDVQGDISVSLEHLLDCDAGDKSWDLQALAERRNAMFERMHSAPGHFGPCAVLDELRQILPDDGIMTCDVGAHIHLIGQKWPTPQPGKQIMSNGWSSMGFAIPAAIAAKLCKPQLPVCAVVGDGGFLMTAGELAVAVREQLNIVFVVLSDNDLALIRIKQEKKNNPVYGTPVRREGSIGGDNIFGVPVTKAHNAAQFRQQLQQAFNSSGPSIVEAIIDSREYDDLVLRKDRPE